uniref:Uncharacterized protein n=1 Tax=Hyaloperonospora arabidopsidis (strain Emoy2) TaxID=559515 RepID=M4BRG8_HYAAE
MEIKEPVIKAEELILDLDQTIRINRFQKRSRGVLAAMTADKESLVVQGKVANSVSSAILETPSDHPVEKLQASYDKEIVQPLRGRKGSVSLSEERAVSCTGKRGSEKF